MADKKTSSTPRTTGTLEKTQSSARQIGKLKLKPKNWGFIFAGMICIAFGFFLLSRAILAFSAVLIIVGYCILVPIGIILNTEKSKIKDSKTNNQDTRNNNQTNSKIQ